MINLEIDEIFKELNETESSIRILQHIRDFSLNSDEAHIDCLNKQIILLEGYKLYLIDSLP